MAWRDVPAYIVCDSLGRINMNVYRFAVLALRLVPAKVCLMGSPFHFSIMLVLCFSLLLKHLNFRGHFRVLGGYRLSPSTLPAFDPSVQHCSCVLSFSRPSLVWPIVSGVCSPYPWHHAKKVFWMGDRSCGGNVLVLAKQPLSLTLSLSLSLSIANISCILGV